MRNLPNDFKRFFITIRKNLILILILSFAGFLRFWKVTEIPPLWVDEIPNGILSFEILKFGILKHIFLPKLLAAHEGPMLAYTLTLPIYFFGFTNFALRIPFPIFGVLSILLTYIFIKNFYNKKIALLTVFLLTIFPSHIFFSRIGFEYIIVNSMTLFAIIFLQKFTENKLRRYFYLFSLVVGIGIATRLSFFLFTIPLIFLWQKIFKLKLKRIGFTHLFVCLLIIFFVGIYPYLFSNLMNDGFTIQFLLQKFPQTTEGINLLDIPGNLKMNLQTIIPQFFRGQYFYLNFNSISLEIFLLSFLIFITTFIIRRKDKNYTFLKKDFFLISFILLTGFLFSTITITTFRHGDHLMLTPFYLTISGKVLHEFFYSKKFRKIFIVFGTIILLFIVYDFYNFFTYFYSSSTWERKNIDVSSPLFDYVCIEKVKDLADFLSDQTYSFLIIDDPNVLHLNLKWYGNFSWGKMVNLLEYTENVTLTTQIVTSKLEKFIHEENSLYIFTTDDCLRFGPIHWFYKKVNVKEIFFEIAEKYEKTPEKIGEITSNGYVLYEIYKI